MKAMTGDVGLDPGRAPDQGSGRGLAQEKGRDRGRPVQDRRKGTGQSQDRKNADIVIIGHLEGIEAAMTVEYFENMETLKA